MYLKYTYFMLSVLQNIYIFTDEVKSFWNRQNVNLPK